MPSRSTIEGRLARAAVDSFSLSLGVRCLLLTRDGKALYAQSPQGADCAFCERLRDSLQLTGLHCRAPRRGHARLGALRRALYLLLSAGARLLRRAGH